MSVRLFKHNQMAYEAVRRMLEETGKAAVIHPTGTGKTYIAFRLVEDCGDKKFLWLSPSEYIFRTQLEQLLAQDPEFPKEKITFLSYARLLTISDEELAALCSDTIILDEFHRCGARVWGERLQRVLQMYPDAEILGLSATAIRYLDNDRDMAEELFDKNVASEITLGEAIVKGILKAPVYVSAVYDHDEILQRYQTRIRNQRGRGLQEQNQKYLEALRRSLEMSEGLEQIFQKYLTDPSGKYLVFCANVEHLTRMKELAGKWFGAIDKAPHIYSVYADSPQAMEEYNRFQIDSSEHLKLLYCIDMLNEGVHVKGISGVILFRPTVSPTIYKQQIGRALTAGEEKSPLIIDVVNNAESLCSIDVLKKEMAEAVCQLRREGQDEEIVTETFTIEEQVEDCRKLFRQLEGSLSSGWEQYFQAAKTYSKEHGHTLLEMPRHYVSPEGLSVGNWIQTQKLVRSGKQTGTLTKEQIQRLDGIGMVWDLAEWKWQKNYAEAFAYVREHGTLAQVPAGYCTESGFALGTWIQNLRRAYQDKTQAESTWTRMSGKRNCLIRIVSRTA